MDKTKHLRLIDRTPDNDIRYRGPLSYRGLRIIGWICMAFAQAAIVIRIGVNMLVTKQGIDMDALTNASAIGNALSIVGSTALSMFLVANFALILQSRENLRKLIRTHLIGAVSLYLVFILLYRRYLFGYFELIFKEDAQIYLDNVVTRIFSSHLSFNIFVDLSIYSSMYFFLTHVPKKHFQGKKIAWFRLLALIPTAYEVTWFIIKGLGQGLGLFSIPVILIPLMPTKPVFTFLAFVGIILHIRRRRKAFLKKGKTEEQYKEFLETNANSLSFSLFVTGAFLIAGLVDIVVSVIAGVFYMINYWKVLAPEYTEEQFVLVYVNSFWNSWGLGKSVDLILGAPVVMLFSYTKKHSPKTKMVDTFLPFAGVALCLIVYLEGFLIVGRYLLAK